VLQGRAPGIAVEISPKTMPNYKSVLTQGRSNRTFSARARRPIGANLILSPLDQCWRRELLGVGTAPRVERLFAPAN